MEEELYLYRAVIDIGPSFQHIEFFYAKNGLDALGKLYESTALKEKLNYSSTSETEGRDVIIKIVNVSKV